MQLYQRTSYRHKETAQARTLILNPSNDSGDGHLRASAALPTGEVVLVPTDYEARWTPGSISTFLINKCFAPSANLSTHDPSAVPRAAYMTPTQQPDSFYIQYI